MTPSILISNKGRLFFPPSSCGVKNTQMLKIKNTSGLPLMIRFIIQKNFIDELQFEKIEERFEPFETKEIKVFFMPIIRKKYKIKCKVQVYDEQNNHIEREQQEIKVFGEGGDGQMYIYPQKIDFKMVKINFVKKEKIFLHNVSENSIYVIICMNEEQPEEISKSISTLISTSGYNQQSIPNKKVLL
jgi:hypothetical protein